MGMGGRLERHYGPKGSFNNAKIRVKPFDSNDHIFDPRKNFMGRNLFYLMQFCPRF